MTHAILWISHVVLSLLFVAMVTEWGSHCKKTYWRKIWPILTAVLVFITMVPAAILGGFLLWGNMQPKWLVWYGLSGSILYLVGALIILKKGLKVAAAEEPAAKSWPGRWLAVSFGVAVLVFLLTLNVAELKIVTYVTDVKNMATHKIIGLLPANLPAALNAHPAYEEAVQELGSRKDLPDWFSEIDRPDFDAANPDVQGFLSKQNNTLAAVRRAVSMPGYSMEIDVSALMETKIPNLIPYRDFARLLRLSAVDAVIMGRPAAAVQELNHIEHIGNHLRELPLLISLMVSFSIDTIYYTTLEYLLAQDLGPDPFRKGYPIRPHATVRDRYLKALRLEAYSNLQVFAATAVSNDFGSLFGRSIFSKLNAGGTSLLMTLWRIFLLPSEIRAAKDIISYRMGKPAATYEEHRKNIEMIRKSLEAGDMSMFTKAAVPNYLNYAERAMVCDVQKGLCDLAWALTRYKAVNKVYPAKLEELMPAFIEHIPLDPYDGKPLKMTPVAGGLKLFSTGPDKNKDPFMQDRQIDFFLGKEAFLTYRVKGAAQKE